MKNTVKKICNKDVQEKCTETKASSSVIKALWWRFIKQTSTGITSHPLIPFLGKYILVERGKKQDRYTDRLQLLERRLDTLQGEPFHYPRHILRTCSQKYKQPASLAVSNNQHKCAKKPLYAG